MNLFPAHLVQRGAGEAYRQVRQDEGQGEQEEECG